MGISTITIKNGESVVYRLESAFTLAQRNARLSVDGKTVSIGAQTESSMLSDALSKFLAEYRYISSICNSVSTDDGQFWIHVDRCTSWTSSGSGMIIYDLCPACSSCAKIMNIKSQIEDYRILLNMFKDASLYTQSVLDARKLYLQSKKISVPDNCAGQGGGSQSGSIKVPELKATQLLRNYVTLVHMWNYVVSHMTTRTNIISAPDDEAGLVVQSTHALPVCDKSTHPVCTISIEPVEVQSGLSAYVPQAETFFTPFSSVSPVQKNQAVLDINQCSGLKKVVKTTFTNSDIVVSGTYGVTVKYLPFRFVQLKDTADNVIDLYGNSWFNDYSDTKTMTPDGAVITTRTLKTGVVLTTYPVEFPTEENYLKSRAYPSKTADVLNIWKITITWAVGENETSKEYYFQTTGVRDYDARTLGDNTIVVDTEDGA